MHFPTMSPKSSARKSFEIITVGSTNLDLFVDTADRLFHASGASVHTKGARDSSVTVDFGSKILVNNLSFAGGGGAHNAAVNLHRLAFATGIVSVIGNDGIGESIRQILQQEGISQNLLLQKEGQSGLSIILDSAGHDRTILAYKGVADHLRSADIPLASFAGVKGVYFSSMLGESLQTEMWLMEKVYRAGAITVFNPSFYLAQQGIRSLSKALANTTLLILNKEEAYALVRASIHIAIREVIVRIARAGPNNIVVTDGPHELVAFDGSAWYHMRPPRTKVVETTGAGAAFASSCAAGFIRAKPFSFCLALGMAQSQNVVVSVGATSNLASWLLLPTQATRLLRTIRIEKL